jgi:predicted nucleic acid-binding Zn finger protein
MCITIRNLINKPIWEKWSDSLHSTPEQIKRQICATQPQYAPLVIDRASYTGKFAGPIEQIYETSLTCCTCDDFIQRNLPCKHMYSLAACLGLIELYTEKYYENNLAVTKWHHTSGTWGGWDQQIHVNDAQRERMAQAMAEMDIILLNQDKQISEINGYEVQLSNCTCSDFFLRTTPCKHIYRLAMELNILEAK